MNSKLANKLTDKDLINGIILNRVDRTITYYSVEKQKKHSQSDDKPRQTGNASKSYLPLISI